MKCWTVGVPVASLLSCSLLANLDDPVGAPGADAATTFEGSRPNQDGGTDSGEVLGDAAVPAEPACGPNLLTNGGFENGFAGWRGNGLSQEQVDPAAARTGLIGLRICATKAFSGSGAYQGSATHAVADAAAGDFVLRAWFRTRSDGGTNGASLSLRGNAFATLVVDAGSFTAEWRCVAARGTTLPTEVAVNASNPIDQCYDVDDVEMFRKQDDAGPLPGSCACQ
jgi:hypothetical protein